MFTVILPQAQEDIVEHKVDVAIRQICNILCFGWHPAVSPVAISVIKGKLH